jgi:two-component system, cell cycle sensor histidine kinase and response regulator CckA
MKPMADVTGPPAPAGGPQNAGLPTSGAQGQAPQGAGSIDRSEQPGRVGLLLVLAGLLVGAAIGLSFVANEQAQSLIVWLLALLAMAGVFFLFALAIGALQLSGSAARDDITKGIVDASPDGALVVEDSGRLI